MRIGRWHPHLRRSDQIIIHRLLVPDRQHHISICYLGVIIHVHFNKLKVACNTQGLFSHKIRLRCLNRSLLRDNFVYNKLKLFYGPLPNLRTG